MNLPNILTVLRIILTFLFVAIITHNGLFSKILAAFIFLIASLTDFFDGYYAKKNNLVTDFGKFMDPLADKFLILAAFFAFVQMHVIALWMLVVIAVREVSITAFRLHAMRQGEVLEAEMAGKYKTTSQMIAISIILIFLVLRESKFAVHWSTATFYQWYYAIDILMFVAVGLTLISGILYLWHNRRFFHASY